MAKFSIGQQVVCINSSATDGSLICGEVYEVRMPTHLGYMVTTRAGTWSEERFTLFEPKKEIMNNSTKPAKIPHIHAEMIIAWASGEDIEYCVEAGGPWQDCTKDGPAWCEATSYRIKPESTYPETTLTGEVLHGKFHDYLDSVEASHVHVANEAIKHFIVSGDMNKYLESLK